MAKVKVLVVDDSALMRRIVTDLFNGDDAFQVVAAARNGKDALEKITKYRPDLMTLDLEMPEMNGLEVLKTIMEKDPLPVIMLSSHTARGSKATMEALSLGAFDFVAKPGLQAEAMEAIERELLLKSKAAVRQAFMSRKNGDGTKEEALGVKIIKREIFLVAIGASTGGPKALEQILMKLPGELPVPVIVTQHMPEGFTGAFAERLDRLCRLRVKEGQEGDRLEKGTVYIAPGGYHMTVRKEGCLALSQEPPVEHVRPSVDVMLSSAVKVYGGGILGIILTGMGKDGAAAMAELKKAGGRTVVQDRSTSVIYNMPKAVIDREAADLELPLAEISDYIVGIVGGLNHGS